MTRARIGLTLGVFVLGLTALSTIGYAQTGRLKGKVVDAENKPVEGAAIADGKQGDEPEDSARRPTSVVSTPSSSRPGTYIVTASKGNLEQTFEVRVSIDEKEQNFTLKAGGGGGAAASDADRKKAEAEIGCDQDACSSRASRSATRASSTRPSRSSTRSSSRCPSASSARPTSARCTCGRRTTTRPKRRTRRRIEINPSSAEAYMGLANVYNVQKKFDQATEAGAQAQKLLAAAPGGGAGGGASASAVFNQGVIAWNESKIPEAQKLFEQAVAADPKMAEAHYWLGMANVNQGKLPEAVKSFEEYLKLDASGQYAEQAKGMLAAIKK